MGNFDVCSCITEPKLSPLTPMPVGKLLRMYTKAGLLTLHFWAATAENSNYRYSTRFF
jgi:hypothetical protein